MSFWTDFECDDPPIERFCSAGKTLVILSSMTSLSADATGVTTFLDRYRFFAAEKGLNTFGQGLSTAASRCGSLI